MQSMGYTDESSDPEWKEETPKEKSVKQIPDSSLKKNIPIQKFCEKWMKLFDPWLTRSQTNPNKPFCRACQCSLDCNRCHLQRHERTSKHARNLKVLIERGEEAARENYNIRQERSKYYHQRKKSNLLQDTSLQASDNEMYSAEESEFVEGEAEDETSFDFVQTDAASAETEQYDEESNYKQENNVQLSLPNYLNTIPPRRSAPVSKKERMKLFMQIQKDKNDLMSTFKDLIGTSNNLQLSPPKEKNHVDLFFESVSSSIKALSPKFVAEAKMRVSQLVCELELRALAECDTNTTNANVVSQNTIVVSPSTGNPYLIHQTGNENVVEEEHQHGVHSEHDYETMT